MAPAGDVRIVPTGCSLDCGGRCQLKVHVKDGRIQRIETDESSEPQLRACLRGRAYRQMVYAPERLMYPLKRIGERGEGRFQRISWDEALDTVANELKRVKETHGPSAIFFRGGSGSQGVLHSRGIYERLLAACGGYTRHWGGMSFEGGLFASMATYGTMNTGNTRDDLLNSRMIILWGWNPADTVWDTNTCWQLARAREKGAKIICVDPRHTNTAAALADEWIPIRPGTDAAMLIAMAYVMVRDELYDQRFLDRYTVGFDKFRDYVMGTEDGQPRTPAWAAAITGVSAATIEKLARQYATTRPAALVAGWGPGRSALGEQYHRAANTLAAMTGNIGIPGGFAAGFMRAYTARDLALPYKDRNPVEKGTPPRPYSLHTLRGAASPTSARIHASKVYDAILRGKEAGYPTDIKFLFIAMCNMLTSHANLNRGIEALKKVDFVLVCDQVMTATAKFADILLPAGTFMERSDIASAWLGEPYYIHVNQAIGSPAEVKSDLEVATELARRLGIADFFGERSEAEILRETVANRRDIPDYDTFKETGICRVPMDEPVVAFKEQIQDPEHHPFPTPSGKIEIYSQLLADMNHPLIPPIPKYLATWESADDPLVQRYPLQLITPHFKRRAHSGLDNVPWLREVQRHEMWINPRDAQDRGIADGDMVRVFNQRGEVLIGAHVTERIMPGVVDIGEGAWYLPDETGLDRGGCANVLTIDEHSPGGAFAFNTCLVQVEKA